jgi:signal transduction histidine kinase
MESRVRASLEQAHKDAASAREAGQAGEYVSEGAVVRDDLGALLAISRALAGKLDLPVVLGATMNVIGELLGVEGASILLIDPLLGGMSFFVAEGPHTQVVKSVALPPGAGICGHVALTGLPLIANDAQNDPRLYRTVDQATGMTTRNVLCVPIRSHERLWGVLEVINKVGDAGFDAHDRRVAEVVATEAALALENAHLHSEIVQKERMAAIGQTVSGLAHCIKNILNGIRSGSAVVDRAMAGGNFQRVGEGWQTVRRNNGMLSRLVLDMLALARDSKPHPFPTDVNDLAEQVTGLMKERAAELGISLTCIPAAGLPDVLLDPTHFYRCLLNLVSNAIDACDGGGHVRVRVHRGNGRDRFTVSVTDDGQGISEEARQKLFAEFFTTKGGRGTGLGLPVTKKLVEEMGGTISFHSTTGRGTRFVLTVPIPEATA